MEENQRKEEEGGGKRSEDSVKLFVGQIPKQFSESDLAELFAEELTLVDEVNIIRDKVTKASKGCCFVICSSRKEADRAVDALHSKKTLPGASGLLQVKYADGELERLEHKLFVGMLPKNVSEDELSALFSQYGTITESQILRGSQQTSKACAFLKYETKDQARAALETVNGKHKMEGSNVPLVVKWADTEKERQSRKAQCQAPRPPFDLSQNPSLYGAVRMGYLPPYNGYSYQAPGSYGAMPYRLPSNQPPYHLQGNGLRVVRPDLSSGAPRSYSPAPAGFAGSGYPTVPNSQYPMTYPGRMMSQRPLPNSSGFLSSPVGASPDVSPSSKSQPEGPPGANLFIYHIPQEYGDQDLADTFQRFGSVLSAKVFIDKATGMSKCFGFVSYDSPASAQTAISVMNGFQLGGKKLKVQLKRDRKNGTH